MEQLALSFDFVVDTKLCIRCGIEKHHSAFGKNPIYKNKDGIRQPCKACRKTEREKPEEKEKDRIRHKNYSLANKDRIAEKAAIRYKKNKPKRQAYLREYYELNKDHLKTKARDYVRNNSDANKAKCILWYRNNSERVKQYYSRTYPLKKEQFNVYSRTRRARKKGAEGYHSESDIQDLFKKQNGKCNGCSGELQKIGKQKYHVDHMTPLSRGGSNWPENLQLLCASCNLSKHDKTQEEWDAHKEKLSTIYS